MAQDKPDFIANPQNGPTANLDQGPEQTADAIHDGAPGGLSMGDDLPSVAVPGGPPATYGGYTPDASQDQLPAPGSTTGDPVAPSGIRR